MSHEAPTTPPAPSTRPTRICRALPGLTFRQADPGLEAASSKAPREPDELVNPVICGRRDSNPHGYSPPGPKPGASTSSATPARTNRRVQVRMNVSSARMAERDPDVVIEHPNREKAANKATKA